MPKVKTDKRYVTRLRVLCAGDPLDMMRYDHCVPATEGDSHKIRHVLSGGKQEEIEFIRYAATPALPTFGRWESFGCHVLTVDGVPA